MGDRFVRPESVTLTLANGDTLTVKKRLNSGEQRAMFARMAVESPDGNLRSNPLKVGVTLITAYLLDWSFTDSDNNKVAIRNQPIDVVESALDALDGDSFNEVYDAIMAHENKHAAARAEEKKVRTGATPSPLISESLDALVGSTSG